MQEITSLYHLVSLAAMKGHHDPRFSAFCCFFRAALCLQLWPRQYTNHSMGLKRTHSPAIKVAVHPKPMAPIRGDTKAVVAAPIRQRQRLLAATAVAALW